MFTATAEIKDRLVGLDIETHRMSPSAVLPRAVCVTSAFRVEGLVEPSTALVSNGDGVAFVETFEGALDEAIAGRVRLVGHNIGGFDLPDIFVNFPHLISKIFLALEAGRIGDTLVREKLLNLADHGQIDDLRLPDGSSRKISYTLEALVSKYLGFDRAGVKDKDAEDRWQLNFGSLEGISSAKYPEDAASYARTDALDALLVFEAQERLAATKFKGAIGHDGGSFDVFRTESLHVGAMFCLALMTATGFRVDQEQVARMKERVLAELTPERSRILIDAGILTAALPARPYKNGAVHADGTPKMVPPEPEHISKKRLIERIEQVCRAHDRIPKRTDPTQKFPQGQVSADGEAIGSLSHLDPVLAEYEHRNSLTKLVTNEIPRLETYKAEKAPEESRIVVQTIHPNYDFLKRTGRTSSFASKHYPSTNIQQIARGFELEDGTRIEPRRCYLPRIEGWLVCSCDYGTLELVTFAQKCFTTFGHSVLRETINSGKDAHAYLASVLAYELDNDFYQASRSIIGPKLDRDRTYDFFHSLKKGSDEEKKFYKKWRSLSKPVGLALPGGLGAETLIYVAKHIYGVTIESVEHAKRLKVIWGECYPEGPEWLRHVPEKCKDDVNSTLEDEKLAYFTPLGMYRAGCDYCAACNGAALQAPAGEGAKIAIFEVTRACFDPVMGSCLLGCLPGAFVHDELLVFMPDDRHAHDRSFEISNLMVSAMKVICPDVKVTAEPALARRWDKNMEPVFKDERLVPWEPKK